jgi:hypothetical protein
MEITKREILTGGPLVDAPGHYRIIVTVEGDDEHAFDVVRKPDGTFWKVARVDLFPKTGGMLRIDLGEQIVEPKALQFCEQHFKQLKEAEAATLKVLVLRRVPESDPQRYELQYNDTNEKTHGYFHSTEYGTEEEIRSMLKNGGLTEGQIEFYFAKAS